MISLYNIHPTGNQTDELIFICPEYIVRGTEGEKIWLRGCEQIEKIYFELLEWGLTTEEASQILPPNCLVPKIDEEEYNV